MDPAALRVLHWTLEARRKGQSAPVSLPGADLRGAQLLRADLVGADLGGAGLDFASLAGAKLGRARLCGALLREVDLNGADLTEADLRGADLSAARLEGATLAGADLCGACLDGVVGEPASLAGAKIDRPMCSRSGLSDSQIIRLWRRGAVLIGLSEFGLAVRSSCVSVAEALPSDVGPSSRELDGLELEARRHRLGDLAAAPAPHRGRGELIEIEEQPLSGREGPPISSRSLRLVAQILPPSALAAPAWQAGDVVLGARLEEVVGQGSAATVWRARSADGDLVAVKLFDTTKCNVGLTLPAYRRGVQVMNRLTALSDRLPPTVARLRCVSLNLLGFVTDLAAEGSAVSLPARAWPPERSVAFFRKLCGAVAAAHDEGVLHRCIKPSNILLDAALDPVLTDFDTADLPALAAGSADACGYRPYAAPEELAGGGTQSPTADIYALGRLLEFLLLGRDPDAGAQPGAELEAQGGVPEGLVRIARKCTMPAPEERYQWVGDLLEDLDGHESAEFVGLGRDEAPAPVPYGVSALAPRTPWLGRLRRAVRRSAPPPLAAAPGPSTTSPPRSGRRRLWPRRLWPRRAPASVAAAGAALLVGSVLAAALAPRPSEALLDALRLVTALGAAGVSLLMSPLRVAPRASRVLAAAACALLVYLADFPELAAPPASRAPVERGSGAP